MHTSQDPYPQPGPSEPEDELRHPETLPHEDGLNQEELDAADVEDLSQGLSLAGLAMLAVFVIAMLSSVLPARLADRAWQQGMVIALIDNSVIALLALVLLHLAVLVNPIDPFSRGLRDGAARWAVLAALLYALLVPQQLVVAIRSHQNSIDAQQRQEREIVRRFVLLRQAVNQSGSSAELQQRLEAVVGPSFGRLNPAEPLPQLKRSLLTVLSQNEQRLRQQLRRRTEAQQADAQANLLSPPLRASLSSLAYALAFAALARRRGKRISLLASLLLGSRGRKLQQNDDVGYIEAEHDVAPHSPPPQQR